MTHFFIENTDTTYNFQKIRRHYLLGALVMLSIQLGLASIHLVTYFHTNYVFYTLIPSYLLGLFYLTVFNRRFKEYNQVLNHLK